MSGRPTKPTHLKLVEGNRGKRATNPGEPTPDLLEDLTPPSHLSPASAAVWNELAPKLKRAQLLTEIDTVALEATCDAIAQYRMATALAGGNLVVTGKEGGSAPNPYLIIQSMSFKRINAMLMQFGMTPAARARVAIAPQGDLFADPLGSFQRSAPAA